MSALHGANDPQSGVSRQASSSAGGRTEEVATHGTHAPTENNYAARAPDGHDAMKLKNENERLLSELKSMKQQMQVVQGREQGITKAYLGVCRDLDKVSVPSSLHHHIRKYCFPLRRPNVHLRRR